MVAATQAVRQAGILDGGVDRREVAVLIGTSIGGFSASDHFFRDYYLHGWRGPLVIPTSMNTAPSANVSIRFGLGGPLINLDAACASGAHSIGYAFNLIRTGGAGAQHMTAVTGFDDRSMVNQCLLYRYVVSYEPYNFKGHLRDYPLTLAYGKRMDALRAELREWFWDGEFRDTCGARVTASGQPHHPYAVYLGARSRTPGLVVASYDDRGPITLDVEVEGAKAMRWRTVDDAAWHAFEGRLVLPARSAAVLVPV